MRRIGPEHAAAFGSIVAEAFGMTQGSAALLAELVPRPDWYVYLSFDSDEPAGAGTMFVRDQAA